MKVSISAYRNVHIELSHEQIADAIIAYLQDNYQHPLTGEDIDQIEGTDLVVKYEGPDDNGRITCRIVKSYTP